MSARALDWAREQVRIHGPKIPLASRMILLCLADRANDEDLAWPSIDTLVDDTGGISRSTIFRHLEPLYGAGLVEKVRRVRDDGGWRANGFRLLITAGQTPRVNLTPPPSQIDTPPVSTTDPPRPNLTPPPVSLVTQQEPTRRNPPIEPTTTLFIVDPPSPNGERPPKPPTYDHKTDPVFARFWAAYPRKIGKPDAFRAWQAAIKTADPEAIIVAAAAYRAERAGEDERYTKHPGPWLRAERYNDAPPTPTRRAPEGRHDEAREGLEESLR